MLEATSRKPKLEIVRNQSLPMARARWLIWSEDIERQERKRRFVKDVVVVCAWGAITLLTVSAVIQAWDLIVRAQ